MKIILRKFRFADYLRILFMMLDKEYSKEREDTFFSYFLKGLKSVFQKNSYEFIILIDRKFAGNIGLFNINHDNCELGYMVLRNYRGKGVTTKAVNKIIKLKFKKLNITKIYAKTNINNKSSQKVLIKNNFKLIKENKKSKEFIWEKIK